MAVKSFIGLADGVNVVTIFCPSHSKLKNELEHLFGATFSDWSDICG
jgi:hypothetical protein